MHGKRKEIRTEDIIGNTWFAYVFYSKCASGCGKKKKEKKKKNQRENLFWILRYCPNI